MGQTVCYPTRPKSQRKRAAVDYQRMNGNDLESEEEDHSALGIIAAAPEE